MTQAEQQLTVYNQFKIGYEKLLSELGECYYTKKALENLNRQLEIYNILSRKGTEQVPFFLVNLKINVL